MHETVFVNRIIEEAKRHGEVEGVSLEIGELAHCPPDEILACFKSIVDWKIDFKEIPAEVICTCGFQGHPTVLERGHDHYMIECPKCKETPKVVGGTDVTLVSVDIKD